jgi:predicted  nucleic acid-binding Zn-ribbon protein
MNYVLPMVLAGFVYKYDLISRITDEIKMRFFSMRSQIDNLHQVIESMETKIEELNNLVSQQNEEIQALKQQNKELLADFIDQNYQMVDTKVDE